MRRLWPSSLTGQTLLAVAVALMLAQSIGAFLIYSARAERREVALIHAAAFRLLGAVESGATAMLPFAGPPGIRAALFVEHRADSPLRPGEWRDRYGEEELGRILAEQEIETAAIVVTRRETGADPIAMQQLARRAHMFPRHRQAAPGRLLLAAVELPHRGGWLVARVFAPPGEGMLAASLALQTLLIYALLVGAIGFILRRITRPLAALTGRVERFAQTHDPGSQLAPEGPEDVRRLIAAHNAMEARIAALIDEKDVMLGAIGHDLKTPLAALRVRIEVVDDDAERTRMAATIEEMSRSLDDILSLARAGRPSEPRGPVDLRALAASLTEEYEDLGEPVTLADGERIVAPLRTAWLKGALRNLIGNALRYGQAARVSLSREGAMAAIRVDDDGPGIPEAEMARMLEPFTRGDPSRNTSTGGTGLGLALAKAIAGQHGGSLDLVNRRDGGGAIVGLSAILKLPLA